MEVVHQACAGLDVHQATVVACARVVVGGKVVQEVETFETTTQGLLALCDWLSERGCTHVAMESTGVYWKPVWHVLESAFDLVLVNAGHIRNVPGRKTDVNDSCDLTRTRKQLVREVAQHTQRIQKALEDANIKLTAVISSVMGRSGRAIIEALIAGETDPEKLVALTTGRLKASHTSLVEALRGRVREHHRFLLKLHLGQIDALEAAVRDVEARIGETLRPFRERAELLTTIPGVSDTVAHVIVSEIGIDMSRFPSAAHLISWAGLCPRSDESAGKRRSTRIRKGAPWLKTTLVQAAWAATRKKDCYLRSQFHRIKTRRGVMKAIIAVAASMLTAVYHMLRDGIAYQDLTSNYFDSRDRAKIAKRLIRRLNDLGLEVEIKAAA